MKKLLILMLLLAFSAQGEHPLKGFEKIVGGVWQLGAAEQEFTWGVGKKAVDSRSYMVVDGKRKLVAEGMWYWHDGEKKIKGIFVAIDMPASVFEYETEFQDHVMHNTLATYDVKGNKSIHTETWTFIDANSYDWALYQEQDGQQVKQMGGQFTRKK